MKTFIKNATLVMSDHLICDASILICDGKIVDFGKKVEMPNDAEIIDADGLYVGPGLIDIHAHAAGGFSYYTEPAKAADAALSHGVTDIMPTIAYCLNPAEFLDAVKNINAALERGECENFIGYYMEGPYLNPKFGADRTNLQWELFPDPKSYGPILDAVEKRARVWSIAPERPGIEDFVIDVKKRIPDIVFTVAHSEATPEQIEHFMPYGLKIGTHHTNATGTIENYPECRGVCVDETVNYNSEIYAELICDKIGIHVSPYMLRLVRKIKGDDKIILISDADVDDGPIPPGYDGADDIIFDHEGEIAGTCLTLDKSCKNMMIHTGCSVCDVFKFASRNPARALSLCDRGEIRRGNVANLIIVDHNFNVKKVFLKGKLSSISE